jgi:hypothetical protein
MSDEIQQQRSPKSPKFTVEVAIETTKRLLDKIGRSAVNPETAVNALGYSSMNGASLTTLGALSHYGLVERENSEVRVSALAFKILHPVNASVKDAAVKEAALTPKAFAMIHEKWPDLGEGSLTNTLIHAGFTPDGAKRAASVYKANVNLAKLDAPSNSGDEQSELSNDKPSGVPTQPMIKPSIPVTAIPGAAPLTIPFGEGLMASIQFPTAQVSADDFDLFIETLQLWKKKLVKSPTRLEVLDVRDS